MKLHLAPFRIETEAGSQNRLRTRKTESVLAYLSLRRGQWVTRTELLNLFWSGAPVADSRPKLRLALHSIRGVIGSCLEAQGDQVRVAGLWVDVLDADPGELIGANLLPDRSEEWLIPFQLELDSRLRLSSIQSFRNASSPEDQIEALLSLIRVEPLNPSYHSALYEIFLKQGHLAAASSAARQALEQLGAETPAELAAAAARSSRALGQSTPLEAELAYRLLGPNEPAVVSLIGPAGIGKTHMARGFLGLARAEEIETIFLDFERLDSTVPAFSHFSLALAHAQGVSAAEVRLDNSPPTLLVLDGVENRPLEEFAFLVDGTLNGSSLRVLLTTQVEPPAAFGPVRLPRQSLPEGSSPEELSTCETVGMICRLLDRSVDEFEPDLLCRAALSSGGLPLAIKFAAQELAMGTVQAQRADLPLEARLLRAFQRLTEQQQKQIQILGMLQPAFHVEFAAHFGIGDEDLRELASLFWIEPAHDLETYEILPPILRFLATVAPPRPELLEKGYEAMIRAGLDQIDQDYLRILKVFRPSASTIELMIRRDIAEGRQSRAASAYPILYFCWHQHPEVEKAIDLGAACLGAAPNPLWDEFPASLNAWASASFFSKRSDIAEPLFAYLAASKTMRFRYLGQTNLGLIEMSRGRADLAVALMRQSLEDPEATLRQRVGRMNNLAKALFLNGESSRATQIASEAIELCGDDDRLRLLKGVLCFSLAEMNLLLNQEEAALRWARRAMAVFDQAGAKLRLVQTCLLMAAAAIRIGERVEACSALVEAGQYWRLGAAHWAPAAACVVAAMGRNDEALELAQGFSLDSQETWVQQMLGSLTNTSGVIPLSNLERKTLFEQAMKRL